MMYGYTNQLPIQDIELFLLLKDSFHTAHESISNDIPASHDSYTIQHQSCDVAMLHIFASTEYDLHILPHWVAALPLSLFSSPGPFCTLKISPQIPDAWWNQPAGNKEPRLDEHCPEVRNG